MVPILYGASDLKSDRYLHADRKGMAMLSQTLIRKKILFITVLLTGTLVLLMYCSLQGVYAYRHLTLMVTQLAAELQTTSELRVELDKLLRLSSPSSDRLIQVPPNQRSDFREQVHVVGSQLDYYERQLASYDRADDLLLHRGEVKACLAQMRQKLDDVAWLCAPHNTETYDVSTALANDVQQLVEQVQDLPKFILGRMQQFRGVVRSRYRALIAIIAASSLVSIGIVLLTFWYFRRSVVQPFKTLLAGSRNIARGDFHHKIHLDSQDELRELAELLNTMTSKFVGIEQSLNEKVKQRTREVVRSEQLASVGFLAAGVAHEINNPLASIAWSAEALECRLHEILHQTNCVDSSVADSTSPEPISIQGYDEEQIDVLRTYLRRIQDEAFRCKGITERLLDFSRLGETQRKQQIDISQSVRDVIELVKHLGQYRDKTIEYVESAGVIAYASPTEFKQVALNLLTNALDASEDRGHVRVELVANELEFTLTVTDYGCGMTDDVLQHLFEPFFTRRRDGRGTGLGLSISYRIVEDHGGTLIPQSDGPGKGATLTLIMPLNSSSKQTYEAIQAAA
ncbi:MAG: HAMP domain-containing histidine kinase [Planctomycetales bacterium]|nr:HAMP domain-containing histidine kinase [Planctomycetales bacterium]